jgi:hypothetical protein
VRHFAYILPVVFFTAHLAFGSPISNSLVTILPSSSPAYSGYDASYALDGSQWTDFASNSQGANTHLDFRFFAPVTFDSIEYTDRTSSGSTNNSHAMGDFDFVTSYRWIFSTDADFTNPANIVGTVTVNHNPPTCIGHLCSDLSAFQQVTPFAPGTTAQYLRWQVVSYTVNPGNSPGAANFAFAGAMTATPEPGVLGLVGSGLLALAFAARRRNLR